MLAIDLVVVYLAELDANNNKPWFEANRARYQTLRNDFAEVVQQVIFTVAQHDEHLEGVRAEKCLFRINRDIRFAKDKRPYKTNFSAVIGPGNKSGPGPGYYLEVTSGGRWGVGAGVWMPDLPHATRIRNAIASNPQRVTRILEASTLRAAFPSGLTGESYKRPPKGFDESTPLLDLVKRKHFALWHDQAVAAGMTGDDLVGVTSRAFVLAVPWIEFLREALRVR